MENILDKIYSSVLLKPQADAMICIDERMNYRQLWDDSDALSVYINANIPNDKSPIVVYGHKEPLMLVCFLACMKSGHAYVPIDISVPANRITDIIEQTCTPLIFAVDDITYDKSTNKDTIHKIISDYGGFHPNGKDRICGEDLIYIIFTSGSTGKPKGVQITHDCVIHFLNWALTLGNVKKDAVYINQAPFSFDLSVYELYMSLVSGGTLFCLTKELMSDMKLLFKNFAASKAGIWVSTPSFADMCLTDKSFNAELMPDVKMFLFCGETLLNSTVSKLFQKFPKSVVVNTYGPTESTVAVTDVIITKELNAEQTPLPVGRAKKGTRIKIVDENYIECREGEKGEILIIGNTVGAGYYKNPQQTQKSFANYNIDGIRYRGYLTGDAGYLKDGMLYYCGRIDFQIKFNGYRIELGDIESNLINLDFIDKAVAVDITKNGKISFIAAFVVLNKSIADNAFDTAVKIKKQLSYSLPSYMLPKKIIMLDEIPTTNNGKIDRNKLRSELI